MADLLIDVIAARRIEEIEAKRSLRRIKSKLRIIFLQLYCRLNIWLLQCVSVDTQCVGEKIKTRGLTMFYAAHTNGKMFAKFYTAGGVKKPARYSTYEQSEAFQFETAEAAETFAQGVFGKSAGPAVPVPAARAGEIHGIPVTAIPGYVAGTRPSRHQVEEAMIHGDHELYT